MSGAPHSDAGARHLDRTAIVRGALELIDRDGFDAFSVRRLARVLGVGNMSIYWYVEDREALLVLVLDEVIGEVELGTLPDDPIDAVETLASRVVEAFVAHPHVVPIFALAPVVSVGPKALALLDRIAQLLADAGFDPDTVAAATFTLLEYLTGHLVGVLTDVRAGRTLDESLRVVTAALDPASAPALHGVVPALERVVADGVLPAGLGLFTRALRATQRRATPQRDTTQGTEDQVMGENARGHGAKSDTDTGGPACSARLID